MTSNQTIAEQVVTFNEGMAAQAPAAILGRFAEEQADLDAAGIPAGVTRPGAVMPDGDLLDAYGAATSLTRARDGKPAVVVFYRGAWCPYCNIALRTYQHQVVPALAGKGVELIAVSPQKPDGSLSVKETNELTFTVLSDPGNQLATALGIVTRPTDGARESQTALGIDVAGGNGDGTTDIPMPTTVLVDADGTIRWIDVHPNYTTRTEPQQILDAVTSLRG
ncbi:peroxiredoxin-like family protein [Streptosporangium oxazolinicum]|uniref:thioredoxin-dependent peroxiredoxin n=1 Tax=Streptosporangium oxazolinicum TaxID=909287 RepID=A0ABP8BN21_9ACTN